MQVTLLVVQSTPSAEHAVMRGPATSLPCRMPFLFCQSTAVAIGALGVVRLGSHCLHTRARCMLEQSPQLTSNSLLSMPTWELNWQVHGCSQIDTAGSSFGTGVLYSLSKAASHVRRQSADAVAMSSAVMQTGAFSIGCRTTGRHCQPLHAPGRPCHHTWQQL